MIIYGTKAKVLASTPVDDTNCPSCGQETMMMHIVQKYVHLYWIPFVPAGKSATIQCAVCSRVLEDKEIPLELEAVAKQEKQAARAPLYMFSCLFIIGFIALAGSFSNWSAGKNTEAYLAAPMANDLCILKAEIDNDYPHVVMKINQVAGDSLSVQLGSYGYKHTSDAEKAIDKGTVDAGDYFGEEGRMAQQDLARLFKDGKLEQIIRPGE